MSDSYVKVQITNNTQLNNAASGLSSSEIYLFLTQESINVSWTISTTTGIATANAPGILASPITLAQLESAGGFIQVDASAQVSSARIYISNSASAVTLSAAGTIAGPTASTATFVYDFVEFALSAAATGVPPTVLNIDTTQVDQLGIPMTLQVSPNDPNFTAGSGVQSGLDRETLMNNFKTMATGSLAPFADCLVAGNAGGSNVLRLLNPADVIGSQLNPTALTGNLVATGGTPGNWTASFTITGPGNPIPTNGALSAGMKVCGSGVPAGAIVSSVPGSPTGEQVLLSSASKDTANPFMSISDPVTLMFLTPPATGLNSFFDDAVNNFFVACYGYTNIIQIEQNSGGTNYIYNGNIVEVSGISDINGGTSTYTVLQFTGGPNNSETYNIYYPFFTTNSPLGSTTPFSKPVPPPPVWWLPGNGLNFCASPSYMVFAANGVFADNTLQQNVQGSPTILGALENVIATGLARGCALNWLPLYGSITNSGANTATVSLTDGSTTQGLTDTMYMSSFSIATIPMTPQIPATPATSFTVSSPLNIPNVNSDLLTFSQFYPAGGTWSAFANFLHNGAGFNITIDGRAYALPFDDQGGFSSDLNSATSIDSPASVQISLNPWAPAT